MNELKIPNHIGVIADGNRRWAREKGLKSIDGHKAGVENIEKLFSYMIDCGVKVVSAYVFSTEKFKSISVEVKLKMDMAFNKYKTNSKKYAITKIDFVSFNRMILFLLGEDNLKNNFSINRTNNTNLN